MNIETEKQLHNEKNTVNNYNNLLKLLSEKLEHPILYLDNSQILNILSAVQSKNLYPRKFKTFVEVRKYSPIFKEDNKGEDDIIDIKTMLNDEPAIASNKKFLYTKAKLMKKYGGFIDSIDYEDEI